MQNLSDSYQGLSTTAHATPGQHMDAVVASPVQSAKGISGTWRTCCTSFTLTSATDLIPCKLTLFMVVFGSAPLPRHTQHLRKAHLNFRVMYVCHEALNHHGICPLSLLHSVCGGSPLLAVAPVAAPSEPQEWQIANQSLPSWLPMTNFKKFVGKVWIVSPVPCLC